MANEGLCSTCSNSIWCSTWGEWKCRVFKKRIYNYKDLVSCSNYLKRDKNFKESKCQCKSCLENEMLIEEEEELKCSKGNLTTRKD